MHVRISSWCKWRSVSLYPLVVLHSTNKKLLKKKQPYLISYSVNYFMFTSDLLTCWLIFSMFAACCLLSSCCVAAHCAVCEWGRESGAGVWRRGGWGMEEGRHCVTEQLTLHHSSWAAASDYEHHCRHHWIQPVIQLWKQNDCPHHQWRYYMSPYISIATVDRLVHRLV